MMDYRGDAVAWSGRIAIARANWSMGAANTLVMQRRSALLCKRYPRRWLAAPGYRLRTHNDLEVAFVSGRSDFQEIPTGVLASRSISHYFTTVRPIGTMSALVDVLRQ